MDFSFVPMAQDYADTIFNTWKVDVEVSVYDYANEAEQLLDSKSWGVGLFAVLGKDNELIGELTIEFFDADDEYIEPDDVRAGTVHGVEMWIGFGLRPEMTGPGLGAEFVPACAECA